MPFVSCAAESEPAAFFGFASVWQAYLTCRRRKRGTAQAQRYEMAVLDQVENTARALQQRCFSPSRSLCFIARQPKAREIHAAAFADRVVHHLLVPRLEALFEPVFIHDLYSNRRGKGTHAAVDRLQDFMRSLTGNGQAAWFLQLDVCNFFNSIDRRRLFGLVRRRVEKSLPGEDSERLQEELLWLTRRLLTGNPADTALRQGRPEDFARVPPYKRLANAPPEKGLPIGNLTSQFFANVYLNELDQFVKHQLKCRHYLRYVDDFILLHHDPAQLLVWRQAIADFLQTRLELALKDLPEPRPVGDGANFLGYIVRPHYRLVRRRVVGNLRVKLESFSRTLAPAPGVLRLDPEPREALRATLASYLGHFRHAHSHRLKATLWRRYPWLSEVFRSPSHPQPLSLNSLKGRGEKNTCGFSLPPLTTLTRGVLGRDFGKLLPRWEPRVVSSLLGQWRYFRSEWPGALVLVQVGYRLECLDRQAIPLILPASSGPSGRGSGGEGKTTRRHTSFPLKELRGVKPSQRAAGTGFSLPLRQQDRLLSILRQRQIAYVLVLEEGYLKGGLKRRVLRERYQPSQISSLDANPAPTSVAVSTP